MTSTSLCVTRTIAPHLAQIASHKQSPFGFRTLHVSENMRSQMAYNLNVANLASVLRVYAGFSAFCSENTGYFRYPAAFNFAISSRSLAFSERNWRIS